LILIDDRQTHINRENKISFFFFFFFSSLFVSLSLSLCYNARAKTSIDSNWMPMSSLSKHSNLIDRGKNSAWIISFRWSTHVYWISMTRNKYDIEMNLIRQEDISILIIENKTVLSFCQCKVYQWPSSFIPLGIFRCYKRREKKWHIFNLKKKR
jgi:hypothetical protein